MGNISAFDWLVFKGLFFWKCTAAGHIDSNVLRLRIEMEEMNLLLKAKQNKTNLGLWFYQLKTIMLIFVIVLF